MGKGRRKKGGKGKKVKQPEGEVAAVALAVEEAPPMQEEEEEEDVDIEIVDEEEEDEDADTLATKKAKVGEGYWQSLFNLPPPPPVIPYNVVPEYVGGGETTAVVKMVYEDAVEERLRKAEEMAASLERSVDELKDELDLLEKERNAKLR